MKQFTSAILSQTLLCEGYFRLRFRWDPSAGIPHPGQFFNIRIGESTEPLLRRPFAFAGFEEKTGEASMIYQIRGRSTTLLSRKSATEPLDLAGPFGNRFKGPEAGSRAIIVAGGIGLGPMLYLGSHLRQEGHEVLFIFGCRNADLVPDNKELAILNPVICTDDGSLGFKGTTIDYLHTLEDKSTTGAWLAGCGPLIMLKGCHTFAQARKIKCQVSMEEIMACGVGACAGCVVRTTDPEGYSKVCSDGPVFDSRKIQWD